MRHGLLVRLGKIKLTQEERCQMKKKYENKLSAKSDSRRPASRAGLSGWRWILFSIVGVGLAFAISLNKFYLSNKGSQIADQPQILISKPSQTLAELLSLPPAEWIHGDIALMDLLCAQGLPGAETMNISNCLADLDRWAVHVQSETERNLHQFRENPSNYSNSEGYFRMLIMAVVLYEDFGIRYNPNRITLPGQIDPNDNFFANAQDIFLNGLLEGQKMGTCSSMPVLYIAIGRRLGYPLKLVTTKAHLFVRWDGGTDRFDVEATGKGMNRYDDEHFKQWPFPVTDEEIQREGFLKSLTAAEELAVFLSLRGNCLKESGRLKESAECYATASRLAPSWNAYRALLANTEAASFTPLPVSKFFEPAQSAGATEAVFPGQAAVAPDPNPLKQMNSQ